MYAQLWYDGVEQFYCQASTCQQKVDEGRDKNAIWNCPNLKCSCIPGTTYCGAGSLDLTETINNLVTGTLAVSCAPLDGSTMTATCNFTQSVLQSLFGPSGLSLQGCTFGECVRQSVIDHPGASSANSSSASKQLGGGVVAGLAVVGALALAALLLLIFGFYQQRKARRGGPGMWEKGGGVSVEWNDVSYLVPNPNGTRNWFRGSRKGDGISDDKVILDNLSGYVKPGQLMAVLGPSGT